jgi:hypothetical protein
MSNPFLAAIFAACIVLSASLAAAKPTVSLEIFTEQGAPVSASQEWYKALTELGVTSLRIRSATGSDKIDVSKRGTEANPQYHVTALLSSGGELTLPGGKFKPRDSQKLKAWLEALGDEGPAAVTQKRSAFGLLREQLVAVNNDLKQPLGIATKGKSAMLAVQQLAGKVKYQILLEPGADAALKELTLEEDLRSISRGTALAAILRPAGLVFAPQRPAGGKLHYYIRKPAAAQESWPIGWVADQNEHEVLPEIFQQINAEISEVPLSEALDAIVGRLKVPLLIDQNALAYHDVDLTQVEVSLPEKRMSYVHILDKLLSQAQLKYQLKIDEAGKPLIWVTTVRPIR